LLRISIESFVINILGKKKDVKNPYIIRLKETNPPIADKALLKVKL
jgi:hypothetical protein